MLLNAMRESGRVAIARVVLRSKEQLVAIRPDHEGRVLMMETMIFADEVVPKEDLDGLPEAEELQVSDREIKMAQQLIESLATDFEPERYKDEYREKVLELIEAKAAGEEIAVAPEAPAPAKVPDLMAALEASLAAVGSDDKPKRKSSAKERENGEDLGCVDELEPLGHARDLEDALNRDRAAHEHELAVELFEPVTRTQERAQAVRVEELEAAQVDGHDIDVRQVGDALELGFEIAAREHVELAAQRDVREPALNDGLKIAPRHPAQA